MSKMSKRRRAKIHRNINTMLIILMGIVLVSNFYCAKCMG